MPCIQHYPKWMHAYIHTYKHTYIHTYMYIHTGMYIQIWELRLQDQCPPPPFRAHIYVPLRLRRCPLYIPIIEYAFTDRQPAAQTSISLPTGKLPMPHSNKMVLPILPIADQESEVRHRFQLLGQKYGTDSNSWALRYKLNHSPITPNAHNPLSKITPPSTLPVHKGQSS